MLELLGGKLTVILGLVVVGLIAVAIVARNWSCRTPRPPRDRSTSFTAEVLEVQAANRLTVSEPVGIFGRRHRNTTITLVGVRVPTDGSDLAGEALAFVKQLVGDDMVTIELEDRRDDDGVIVAGNGQSLQVALLEVGYAQITDSDPPDDWAAAEKTAKKAKRGMWKK